MDHLLHPLGVGSGRGQQNSTLLLFFHCFLFKSASRELKYLLINVQKQVSYHFFPWTVVPLLPNKSARVLLAASDVKQQSEERQGSLSDADLVANGSHSWEWPPMSLCGFDKDRDLCSSSIYGSGPLWSLPTRTCRHLCLDEMGGRRMLLTAPFPLCPRLLLYQSHQG